MTDSSLDDLARLLGAASAPDGSFSLGGYRVLKILGQGGMGAVLLAEDPDLARHLAIKVMKPNLGSADDRQRFLREARTAAQLQHVNVVPIYRVGEENGTPFIVMPLLPGEALEARLRREPTPPLLVALKVGYETALGLSAAHEKGLVHRDIKPANLWLEGPIGPFRWVKILDFGLAKSVQADTKLTRSGALLGTPAYMAPEQAAGHGVSARSDLFSLGVVLYQMLTGTHPFLRDELWKVLKAVAVDEPPPPRNVSPSVPVALSQLVMRLLAKRAEDRPATAAAVAVELKGLRRMTRSAPEFWEPDDLGPTTVVEEPVRTHPTAPVQPQPGQRMSETMVESGTVRAGRPPARWHGWKWAAMGAVTVCLPLALLWFLPVRQPASSSGQPTGAKTVSTVLPMPTGAKTVSSVLPMPKPPTAGERIPGGYYGGGPMPAGARVPGERLVVPLGSGVSMEFVWCPPGSFLMGSPVGETGRSDNETQHRVTFTKGFFLGRTEVTQTQWKAVMGSNNNPSLFKGDDLPVETVSWNACVTFCKHLSKRDPQRRRFRLPSEPEWEYACRAGTQTAYFFGEGPNQLGDYAWYTNNSGRKTHAVGMKRPNAWGLFDMHGNVWEWCADNYGPYPVGEQTDPPIVNNSGSSRVLRGGSWNNVATSCRAACRRRYVAASRYIAGFRVCLRLDRVTPHTNPGIKP